MSSVICPLSIVPVRKEPGDRHELVTQWLFGETARVVDRQPKWVHLHFDHDGYEGWVDAGQVMDYEGRPSPLPVRSAEAAARVSIDGTPLWIPAGAVLPGHARGAFHWKGVEVPFTGNTSLMLMGTPGRKLAALQELYLGAPYLWGGRTPFGIDCSGLTQMLFALCGQPLPRDAWQQAGQGETVELIDLCRTGDLAFFDNPEGRIVHVGVVLADRPGERQILHASGRVRIDRLDQEGIFNAEVGRYSHHLRLVRRVL